MQTRSAKKFSPTTLTITVKDTADEARCHFVVRNQDKSFLIKNIEMITGAMFNGYASISNVKKNRIWISAREALAWISSIDETLADRIRYRLCKLGHHLKEHPEWEPDYKMMQNHEKILENSKFSLQSIYGYQVAPNLIKVGRTDLGVSQRINNLSKVYKGNVVFAIPVKNSTVVERGFFETKDIRKRRTTFANGRHTTTEVIRIDGKFGIREIIAAAERAKLIYDNPLLNKMY